MTSFYKAGCELRLIFLDEFYFLKTEGFFTKFKVTHDLADPNGRVRIIINSHDVFIQYALLPNYDESTFSIGLMRENNVNLSVFYAQCVEWSFFFGDLDSSGPKNLLSVSNDIRSAASNFKNMCHELGWQSTIHRLKDFYS